MNNQLASSRDDQVGAPAETAATSLFSHPDVHHASTVPGMRQQGSYTDLFREPTGGSANVN